MVGKSPEFLYIGFILPTLFAFTLIGEGIYKIYKSDEGYFTLFLGLFFLVGIVGGYFFLFLNSAP